MALRLRPFIRLSAVPSRPHTLNGGFASFSTISMHQLQHPAPASTTTRYLPRFLDPRLYWRSSKTVGKPGEVPGQKRPWNPATFYIAIFLLIGSQAIQIIALRLNHDERMRRVNVKIEILKEVIERLQRGEDVDVEKMLGVGNEKEEKSWEDVLKEIEEEDTVWQKKARQKQGLPAATFPGSNTAQAPEAIQEEPQRTEASKPRKALSSRDYGYS